MASCRFSDSLLSLADSPLTERMRVPCLWVVLLSLGLHHPETPPPEHLDFWPFIPGIKGIFIAIIVSVSRKLVVRRENGLQIDRVNKVGAPEFTPSLWSGPKGGRLQVLIKLLFQANLVRIK